MATTGLSLIASGFNPAIQVGIFVSAFITLAEIFKKPANPDTQTTFSIIIGDSPAAGGNVPHLAAFDINGNRIGQTTPSNKDHWDPSTANTVVMDNNQNGHKQAQPEYITVVMNESDMICISAIFVQGAGASWSWAGDQGYQCGAQWYASNYPVGSSNSAPRCVWLSSNDDKGVIASGLLLHIRDFTTDADIQQQLSDNQKRLCQNSARMTFHSGWLPDSIPPFFHPPLEYTRLGDPGTVSGGGLKAPDQGIDRNRGAYNDDAPALPPQRRRFAKRQDGKLKGVSGVKNNRPGHLVVSHMEQHSAKELCEHPASLGPDFVSVVEGLYCDMEAATWWPLCTDQQTQGCFDLNGNVVRGQGNSTLHWRSVDPVPSKNYDTVAVWGSKSR